MSRITIEEIGEALDRTAEQVRPAIAVYLNDKRLQRLVVQKCVEGMSEEAVGDIVWAVQQAMDKPSVTPHSPAIRAALIAALCPTEPPLERDHG